jgi:putative RNA 2'-phosphotransferase
MILVGAMKNKENKMNNLDPVKPTDNLIYATSKENIDSIKKEGLKSKGKEYIELSSDPYTTMKDRIKHGKNLAVIVIYSEKMYRDDYEFLLKNDVWLTKEIPSKYINWDLSYWEGRLQKEIKELADVQPINL